MYRKRLVALAIVLLRLNGVARGIMDTLLCLGLLVAMIL